MTPRDHAASRLEDLIDDTYGTWNVMARLASVLRGLSLPFGLCGRFRAVAV